MSINRDDFEDVSLVDKLAIKIHQQVQEYKLRVEASKQEDVAMKRRKKKASDFLVPPPASLVEARPFSSVMKPFEDRQSNSEIATVCSGKVYSNLTKWCH